MNAHDPWAVWRFWRAALTLLRQITGSEYVGLFARRGGGACELVASMKLHQAALDAVAAVWPDREALFAHGTVRRVADPAALLVPCADEFGFEGIVYVAAPGARLAGALRALLTAGRLLAGLLRGRGGPGSPAPAADHRETFTPEAVAFQELLENNEWNVARVARVLGVTATTVYNRLRRHGIERRGRPSRARGEGSSGMKARGAAFTSRAGRAAGMPGDRRAGGRVRQGRSQRVVRPAGGAEPDAPDPLQRRAVPRAGVAGSLRPPGARWKTRLPDPRRR